MRGACRDCRGFPVNHRNARPRARNADIQGAPANPCKGGVSGLGAAPAATAAHHPVEPKMTSDPDANTTGASPHEQTGGRSIGGYSPLGINLQDPHHRAYAADAARQLALARDLVQATAREDGFYVAALRMARAGLLHGLPITGDELAAAVWTLDHVVGVMVDGLPAEGSAA